MARTHKSRQIFFLHVFTVGAEPQEGGGIAQAWIVDAKEYPGIPCSNNTNVPMIVFVTEAIVVATGGNFVNIFSFY